MFNSIMVLFSIMHAAELFLQRVANGHYANETQMDRDLLAQLHYHYSLKVELARSALWSKTLSSNTGSRDLDGWVKRMEAVRPLVHEAIELQTKVGHSRIDAWHGSFRASMADLMRSVNAI